ncbi:MAG: 16S rRNA (adenine(1518)-N(6)/adenine(1519)-N(6))-dimethyltransferase RsmA [Thermoplasmata archaeon]|nr:16S rRNA (adenine(1518)-N(6)/adenine(1519)-N(6))-dimethyltransferase RsmA [Thermoplasmata archaeon]
MSRTSTGSSSPPEIRPPAVPSGPEAILDQFQALGIRPSRRLGQSFLADPFVADAEAALLEIAPGEPLLEIGGGLGILTEAVLRRGLGPLTILETDPRLARYLARTFAGRATILEADARTYPLTAIRAAIGNLPYAVATPILLRLFAARIPRVVAMVQNEVAERLAATPGGRSYGRLTIAAALYGTVEAFRKVPPTSFVPPPAVESRIVAFTARPGPLPVRSVPQLERAVRILFSSRRKQLGNLLPRLTAQPGAVAAAAGWASDWSTLRPEDLPPDAYFRLSDTITGASEGLPKPRGIRPRGGKGSVPDRSA